jgi:hypothetical protein
MALIACKECKTQMSDQAKACPKCGAPPPKGMSRSTILFLVCTGVIAFAVLSRNVEAPAGATSTDSSKSQSIVALAASADTTRQSACRTGIESMKAKYVALLDQKKFWDAKLALEDCPTVLADATLQTMANGAARLQHLATINDTKDSPYERLRAIDLLRDVGTPEDVAAVEPLRVKLQVLHEKSAAADAKKADAADRARRRKEGVHIGMSQDDVLKSSWGRPSNVNRTTYSFGTREQWVYDGGYLYFEDGILKTIQN